MKMAKDVDNEPTIINYELLCDIETIMGLTCLLLMLEVLQGLNKYGQNKNTFICDFVGSVKLCQANLHNMYHDEEKKQNYNDFPQF